MTIKQSISGEDTAPGEGGKERTPTDPDRSEAEDTGRETTETGKKGPLRAHPEFTMGGENAPSALAEEVDGMPTSADSDRYRPVVAEEPPEVVAGEEGLELPGEKAGRMQLPRALSEILREAEPIKDPAGITDHGLEARSPGSVETTLDEAADTGKIFAGESRFSDEQQGEVVNLLQALKKNAPDLTYRKMLASAIRLHSGEIELDPELFIAALRQEVSDHEAAPYAESGTKIKRALSQTKLRPSENGIEVKVAGRERGPSITRHPAAPPKKVIERTRLVKRDREAIPPEPWPLQSTDSAPKTPPPKQPEGWWDKFISWFKR